MGSAAFFTAWLGFTAELCWGLNMLQWAMRYFFRDAGKTMRAFGFALLACLAPMAEAWALDAQELFNARCSGCHQSAEQLAVANLVIDNEVLRSRANAQDLHQFFPNHYGHPNAEETAALYKFFYTLLASCASDSEPGQGGFNARCAVCHGSAEELARQKLVRKGRVVRGRYSGRELSVFLRNHGRICTEELDYFVQLLMRLAPER